MKAGWRLRPVRRHHGHGVDLVSLQDGRERREAGRELARDEDRAIVMSREERDSPDSAPEHDRSGNGRLDATLASIRRPRRWTLASRAETEPPPPAAPSCSPAAAGCESGALSRTRHSPPGISPRKFWKGRYRAPHLTCRAARGIAGRSHETRRRRRVGGRAWDGEDRGEAWRVIGCARGLAGGPIGRVGIARFARSRKRPPLVEEALCHRGRAATGHTALVSPHGVAVVDDPIGQPTPGASRHSGRPPR